MRVPAATSALPDDLRRQLGPGERLLWHGRPRRGVLLRRADVALLACGLAALAAALAIGVEQAAQWQHAPVSTRLLCLLLALGGGHLALGRILLDASMRAGAWYGVTGERILIVAGARARSVKSLNLAGLDEPRLFRGRQGLGTIVFGPARAGAGVLRRPAPRFEAIPDAAAVHALIQDARHAARAQR